MDVDEENTDEKERNKKKKSGEIRKIYLSGGSSLIISLPKKWAERNMLKAGDSVFVFFDDGRLIIESAARTEVKRRVKEIPEKEIAKIRSEKSLQRLIIAYYLVGYDSVRINFGRRKELRKAIKKITELLIGAEILEDTGDKIGIEILLDQRKTEIEQIIRRVYLICKSMLKDIAKFIGKENSGANVLASEIIEREREVDRLYFLVVRILKTEIKKEREALGYRIAAKSFERISDHCENIALTLLEESFKDAELSKFAIDVEKIYEKAFEAFVLRNLKLAEEVFEALEDIEEKKKKIFETTLMEKRIKKAIAKKAIAESIYRIANYSSDIAEIAINLGVGREMKEN